MENSAATKNAFRATRKKTARILTSIIMYQSALKSELIEADADKSPVMVERIILEV
jgi:hypothetical protein